VFLLAFKLILAPLLIAMATLVGRRWGHGVSGWIAALPLTSGPVSLIFALQYGTPFAAQAAVGTLAGLISVSAFCLVYCHLARWNHWAVCITMAVVAFFVVTFLLNSFALTLVVVFIAVLSVLTLTIRLTPKPNTDLARLTPPKWDLPARMFTAVVFILVVTYAAEGLGPQLSGLITPFPIFASILAVFAHSHLGANASILSLRGILNGLYGFATFFLIVGALVTLVPLWLTYTLAVLAAVVVNAFTLRFVR
jgi:hypothetical protein